MSHVGIGIFVVETPKFNGDRVMAHQNLIFVALVEQGGNDVAAFFVGGRVEKITFEAEAVEAIKDAVLQHAFVIIDIGIAAHVTDGNILRIHAVFGQQLGLFRPHGPQFCVGDDGGINVPEYVLLFRKLPTDTSRAYADRPVKKDKSEYSLARWQIDAHASWKSSGNSLLSYEDMKGAGIDKIRHLFRNYEREHIYNYEEHVSFAEELEAYGKLPKTFMAVDPVSKKDWVWDDVARMRTLNTKQSQKKRQNHICPLQLDIVERLIERYSNKGELVFDPFGGIGTVPYCAIKLGRRGLSTELNYDYWKDGLSYLREAENEVSAPTLFDLMAI